MMYRLRPHPRRLESDGKEGATGAASLEELGKTGRATFFWLMVPA